MVTADFVLIPTHFATPLKLIAMINNTPFKICVLAASLMAPAAFGATIVTDDFSYSNGNLTGNNGGTGWSGQWNTVGGYGSTTVASGADRANPSGTDTSFWNYRQFSTSFVGSPTAPLYFSASFTKSGSETAYAMWLNIGTTTGINPYGVSIGLADNKFSFRSRGASGETNGDFGSITVGQTYQIVGKLEFNVSGANERLTIWIDPTDVETGGTVSSSISNRDVGWTTPSVAEVGAWVMTATSPGSIDNVKIGTAWTNVAVPEPGAALLGGLGLLALLRRRR